MDFTEDEIVYTDIIGDPHTYSDHQCSFHRCAFFLYESPLFQDFHHFACGGEPLCLFIKYFKKEISEYE
ncbi:hypothetical protein JCM12294_29350 [Desulfocicer niacini]